MCRSLTVLSWNISDFTELCSSQAPASWTAEENRAALHCVLCRAVADGDGDVIALQECSDSGFPFPSSFGASTRSCAGGAAAVECMHCGEAHVPLAASHVRTLSARSHSGFTTLLLRRCLMPCVRRLFTLGGCPPLGLAAAVGVTLEVGQRKITTEAAGAGAGTSVDVDVNVDGAKAATLDQAHGTALVDVVSVHLAPHKSGAAERLTQLGAVASALLPRTANAEVAGAGAGCTASIPAALIVGDANWRQCETASLRSLSLPAAAGAAHCRAGAQATKNIDDRLHDHKPAFGLPTWDCVANDYFGSGWQARAFFDRMFLRQGCVPPSQARRCVDADANGGSGDGGGGTSQGAGDHRSTKMMEVGAIELVGADPVEAGSSTFYLSDHFGIKARCTFMLTLH